MTEKEINSRIYNIFKNNEEEVGYLGIERCEIDKNYLEIFIDGRISIKTMRDVLAAIDEMFPNVKFISRKELCDIQQRESEEYEKNLTEQEKYITIPELIEENEKELNLQQCPQCNEEAYDKYICHNCGHKII